MPPLLAIATRSVQVFFNRLKIVCVGKGTQDGMFPACVEMESTRSGPMGEPLHLVSCTVDGCRIARDGAVGYVVHHDQAGQTWQRVANLASAYAVCERFNQRQVMDSP